jgi:opacity protein-like surface antigen
MTPIQGLAISSLAAALLAAGAASAADVRSAGFYGGIAVRDNGAEQGVSIGDAGNPARFAATLDAHPAQSYVFGGYRWRNDLALEAMVRSDDYRLAGRGGVGLVAPGDAALSRSWNVDVVGSWSFWRSFSLYGRLGYAQSDALPVYSTSIAAMDRRYRDGVNVGVGLRYDLSRSLGLKLEYARAGLHSGDATQGQTEGDQVQFGLQFRF